MAPNAQPEHLEKGLNDNNEQVRSTALAHPNTTPQMVTKAAGSLKSMLRARTT